MITFGGVAADNPFTGSDRSPDTSTSAGGEGTTDEEAASADEENSSTSPPSPGETGHSHDHSHGHGRDQADDRAEDNRTEDRSGDSQPENSSGDSQSEESSENGQSEDRSGDSQPENRSGVNFVAGVKDFKISTEVFNESSPDVEDGFVTPGEHRLLRFDVVIYNVGDADAELGRPGNRSDLFEHSSSHGHAHLKGFNNYVLLDESGERTGVVRKQTFCLRDLSQVRPTARDSAQFDCEYQGISAGWADEYDSSLPGQYIVIDDLPDGEYTLRATTNAAGTIDETCYDDNTVRVDLSINNGTVTVHTSESYHVKPPAC